LLCRVNHQINIIQIVTAIGVAEQNPSDTARELRQSAQARTPITASHFCQYVRASGASTRCGRIATAVVNHANVQEAAPPQVLYDGCDSRFLVQCRDNNQARVIE
jgi:hypothetical protein